MNNINKILHNRKLLKEILRSDNIFYIILAATNVVKTPHYNNCVFSLQFINRA